MNRPYLEKALAFADARACQWLPEMAALIEAARAHLATLPKTKMVERWHVEWVDSIGNTLIWVCADTDSADARQTSLISIEAACIRITGPHLHMVPA